MTITNERKEELRAKGFYIENMQEVWGDGWWNGCYRWMKQGTDEFQDGDVSFTEEAAWANADRYDQEISLEIEE